MSEEAVAPARSTGWLESIESQPAGSIWLGLGLTFLLLLGMLLWWVAFGFWDTLFDPAEPLGLSYDGRNHLVINLMVGFTVVAVRRVRLDAGRSLRRIAVASTLPEASLSEWVRAVTEISPPLRALAVASGLVFGSLIIALTSSRPLADMDWDAHHIWAVGCNALLFGSMVEGGVSTFRGWRALDTLTRSLRGLDLLDREALAQIGRYGFPGSITWLIGSCIASFLGWGMQNVWPLFAVLGGTVGLATFSLLRPAQIVHRRLREAKRAELARVRQQVAFAKEAALSDAADVSVASSEAARLPGLLAYEARIESVREWPFDTPTLLRFGALALLAGGSWLGGALVERALSVVLD